MITQMKLVDGVNEMTLIPNSLISVDSMEIPTPEVREVAEPAIDRDGTYDTTSLFGARSVALELSLIDTPADLEDELRKYCHPSKRPHLVMLDDEWADGPRRIKLRAEEIVGPIAVDSEIVRVVSAGFKAPDGWWELEAEQSQEFLPIFATTSGLTWPATWPITFTAATSGGSPAQINNVGNIPCAWRARIYGPCTAPALKNDTTGESIVFDVDFTIGAGSFVELDLINRTAYLDGDTAQSRLSNVNWGATQWWRLQPGINYIRYSPTIAVSAGAECHLFWRPAWL